jgi:hypothetical protein
VGTLGATGTCKSGTCLRTSPFVFLLPDTHLRAIGKRAHALHALRLSFFASQSVLVSTLGCVPRPYRLASFSDGTLGTHPSMIIFKIPIVITTGGLWLLMMFLIDITNLIAQVVCSSIPLATGSHHRSLTCGVLNRLRPFWSWVFQRETASRGSLAMYTSVCLPCSHCFDDSVFHWQLL